MRTIKVGAISVVADGAQLIGPWDFSRKILDGATDVLRRPVAWKDLDTLDECPILCGSEKVSEDGARCYLAIRTVYLPEYMGKDAPACWEASLMAVAPNMVRGEELRYLLRSIDATRADWKEFTNESKIVECLDYGAAATLATFRVGKPRDGARWATQGSPRCAVLCALNEARAARAMLGFRLDSVQNAVGATGWDFLRGDRFPG